MTVSRVIRGKGVVSVRTRERVLETIEQLGFVPNKLAGSLAQARSNQVAVIIPSLVNNVFSQVFAGVTSQLENAGYNPVVGISDYSIKKEEELVVSMMSWRPAGVIVTSLNHTARTRNILANSGVPVVEIMDISGPPIDMSVGLDHRKAATKLIMHLIAKGYTSFGYLGWNTNDFASAQRFQAISKALEERGYPLVAPDIYTRPPDTPLGRSGLKTLLDGPFRPQAVIYSNDTAAVGGILHCLAEGISVPGDLAVSGFSGLEIGRSLPRELTTVRTRRYDTGRTAARNVLRRLTGADVPAIVDMGFELVAGETS